MEISSKNVGLKFLDTEMGSDDITEALNAVQEAYDKFMTPAWELVKQDAEKGGNMAVKRGLAFVVASGAMHMFLSHGSSKSIENLVAEAIGEVVPQMLQQAKEQRDAKAAEVKA